MKKLKMGRRSLIALAVLLGLIAIGMLVFAHRLVSEPIIEPVKPTKPLAKNLLVEIKDSGSTNTKGWALWIYSDGSGKATGEQAKDFAAKTFNTVQLTQSLDNTKLDPHYDCLRSVSFGSVMTLAYKGHTTEGLDCYMGSNRDAPLTQRLSQAIQKAQLN